MSPGEATLLDCCRRGEVAILHENVPKRAAPANRVRAKFVRFLILGGDDRAAVHEHGVRLRGAWLDGTLQLDGATVPFPLELWRCRIEQIDARRASLKYLDLEGCYLARGFNGDDFRCAGSMFLNNGFRSKGEFRLHDAGIGGNLDCGGGLFENRRGSALILCRARIGGGLFLNLNFRSLGFVDVNGATIGSDITCSTGTFLNRGGDALGCTGANIGGTLYFNGAVAEGTVVAIGATVGGDVDFGGARIEQDRAPALLLNQIKVAGSVFLNAGMTLAGEARIIGADIGGDFDAGGGRFENPGTNALTLDGARVRGSVYVNLQAQVTGSMQLIAAFVGGDLDCGGSRFENPAGTALHFDRLTLSRAMFLRNGCEVVGEVRFIGAGIGGDLDCSGSTFSNPDDVALLGERATIGSNLFLNRGFRAEGEVRMSGSVIRGDVNCNGGSFAKKSGFALALDGVRVESALFFRSVTVASGNIDLASARIGNLCDEQAVWMAARGRYVLDGLTYSRIGGSSPCDSKRRIEWLAGQLPEHLLAEFRPQPWEQLIEVLRAMGHANEARRVAIAKQKQLRVAGRIARGARTLHWLYGLLVGYGYRAPRLLAVMASVWLFC
ncbi:MAG TPA: hypothetical protein VN231_12435, partial [Allosphingosinicella sp.]|nr:hypothetical protein [Allosphingosinicella sp.]